jgi:hypothetical protein
MTELVAEDEANGLFTLLCCEREDIGVEDHEVPSEEFCRECVENSARLKDEDRWSIVQPEATCMLVGERVQLGELLRRDPHAIAADVPDVKAVSDEENDDAEYEVGNQRAGDRSAVENGQCQSDVDEEADDNTDGEIEPFLWMYQGLENQRAGRARFRWHCQFLVVGREN